DRIGRRCSGGDGRGDRDNERGGGEGEHSPTGGAHGAHILPPSRGGRRHARHGGNRRLSNTALNRQSTAVRTDGAAWISTRGLSRTGFPSLPRLCHPVRTLWVAVEKARLMFNGANTG